MKKPHYSTVHDLSRANEVLASIEMLLDWDRETYLPSDGIVHRAHQMEAIASILHKERISLRFAKALSKLIDIESGHIHDPTLTEPQIAAAKAWRRDYIKARKLPNSFVKRFANTTATASHAWIDARKRNDFKSFAPHLEKVVSLSRKKADILGYEDHPYDALLDLYEPEMKTATLIPLFLKLKEALTRLNQELTTRPPIDTSFLHRPCDGEAQMRFGRQLLHAMGFTDTMSRLDHSAHPFCTGIYPKDTRMTTRIHPENALSNIFAVLHEGGHGLYNANLPLEHYGSPLGQQVSLGIDESQSRWWETLIGHSQPFWHHFYPKLQHAFPIPFADIALEQFYRAINVVKPSLIRIESDEVTYNLHIIVRFEIEKGLIEGSIKVKEIPHLWNEKMRTYLGISPPLDGQGCLQDIHWSLGLIGYFPTYTLGNLYAAQFFTAFEKDHPDWKDRVASGDLSFIRTWLSTHIHQWGRRFSPAELCIRITQAPLSPDPYLHYLTQKFL